MKLNIRKKGTLVIKGFLGNLNPKPDSVLSAEGGGDLRIEPGPHPTGSYEASCWLLVGMESRCKQHGDKAFIGILMKVWGYLATGMKEWKRI